MWSRGGTLSSYVMEKRHYNATNTKHDRSLRRVREGLGFQSECLQWSPWNDIFTGSDMHRRRLVNKLFNSSLPTKFDRTGGPTNSPLGTVL